MTLIKSRQKELCNGILVDVGVQKLTPNHPFPLQNPGIAASDRFWPSPPRNSYHPQFGSASAITISLIHSWYGPIVGMVSTFSFEQIVHNCHQFDCIVTTHCTRTTLCKMTNADDNIKWFHQHCSSTYNWLETAVPMVDIATFTISTSKDFALVMSPKKLSQTSSRYYQITVRQMAILLYSSLNQSLCAFII